MELYIAEVTENYTDKKDGLLEVKLPGLEESHDIVCMVRMLRPYATGKNGFYFLPETGDIVLVAFLGERYSRGVILGSLYKSENEGRLLDKDNKTKEISSKNGSRVTFTDVDGKEKIELGTPKKQIISMDDEKESITIQAKDGVSISISGKSGEILVEASEKIKLKCGSGELQMTKSGDITINGGKITIGGQKITAEAKTELSMSAQKLEANSKGTVSISGNAKTEIKSSGITEVKGSMVKLNG